MTRTALILTWAALLAGPSFAEGGALFNDHDRAALGRELRDALIADPEPVWQAFHAPPPSPYQDDIDRDLAVLRDAAAKLFDPAATEIGSPGAEKVLALFVRADCVNCERAREDLAALAERLDLRVTVFDLDQHAALAERIGVDMAPSYVLPRMIVRDHVPAVVIEKYLSR